MERASALEGKMVRILMFGWLLLGLIEPAAAQTGAGPQVIPQILEFDRKLCPVCKAAEQALQAVRVMYPGQFEVRQIYIDEEERTFRRYRVDVVPTQVFLDTTGKEVFRHEGMFPKEKLIEKLRELKFIKQ